MNLYLVSQDANNNYDTHDSFVCVAEDEGTAQSMNPYGEMWDDENHRYGKDNGMYSTWCKRPDQATVLLIGTALPDAVQGIILASFNAG
jgi:hypothetical protein